MNQPDETRRNQHARKELEAYLGCGLLCRRIERHLRRRGLLGIEDDGADPDVPGDPESNLAASAVSGQTPPAGPQWVSRLAPPRAA